MKTMTLEIDDFEWVDSAPKRSPRTISFGDDPVALACAVYRIWKNGGPRWTDLGSVTPEKQDREEANRLRQYYAGTMTFAALKGNSNPTRFRQKLYAIVSNCHTYTDEDIGLLYRLPYLYAEDLCFDDIKTQYETAAHITRPVEVEEVFTLDRTLLRSRRSGEHYHYWLGSQQRNYAYDVVVKTDNPLRSVLESLFQKPQHFSATAFPKNMHGYRGFVFLQLAHLQLK